MGRRIKYIIIAIGIILLMALILGRCGNTLLDTLVVDVERATGNIITIKIIGNGSTNPATDIVVTKGDNSLIPITATAYTDWAFIQWQGSGVVFGDANSADTTVQLTGGDTTITALFGDTLLGVPLMINNNGHGTTDQNGLQYMSGTPSTTSTITVVPDTGYELTLSDWAIESGNATVNEVSPGSEYTITVNLPLTTVALADFALKNYTLTANNDGNGTTTPSGNVTVNHGAATPITAVITNPMRYIFDNWTVPFGTAQIGNSNSASTTATLTSGDATVQANFDKYGLYWTTYSNPYMVLRTTVDFSKMTAIAGVSAPCVGIDIDTANEHVYYSDYFGNIWKSDMDGGSQSNIYSTSGYIYAVALDSVNEKLYFAASNIGVGRINLDGSGYETFISGPNYRGVAVDAAGGYVYLSTLSGISRATITTKVLSPLFSASSAYEIDLDVVAGQMYWVEYTSGNCRRAFMNGSGSVTYIINGGLGLPRGIDLDVDNNRMYIASQGNNAIYEYDLTGNLISSFPASGSPSGIAVDTDP